MDPESRECNSCHNRKPLNATEFKAQRDGGFSRTCKVCLDKKKKAHAAKKNKENEHENVDSNDGASEDGDFADFFNMSAVKLEAFLTTLLEADSEIDSFSARVDVGHHQNPDLRTMADTVAKSIWECLHYRFK